MWIIGNKASALVGSRHWPLVALAAGLALCAAALVAKPALAEDGVIVRDFVLTHGIEAREPTDTTETFSPADAQAFAFARLNNDGTPTSVTVRWRFEDTVHAEVDLPVGTSTGWRTWSSAKLKPGHWTVQLVAADGLVLAERAFMVRDSVAEHVDPPAGQSRDDGAMHVSPSDSRDRPSDSDG